jgi:hypothetical protein
MRIYLSSLEPEVPNNRNSNLGIQKEKINSLIMDSEPWTINNKKSDESELLNVGSYISYIKVLDKKFDSYFKF